MSIPEGFKPMLASPANMEKLKFPLIGSPKVDGYRCLVFNGTAYSRNLKPIPNLHIQKSIAALKGAADNHDGEIIIGDMHDPAVFRNTSSGVMSRDGEPNFLFWAFDRTDLDLKNRPYTERLAKVNSVLKLESKLVTNIEELYALEKSYTDAGLEGLMVRSPNGLYKWGRSSVTDGYLLKVKRFLDMEAKVVGFEERLHNANEATKDNLGHTQRSSHKANMIPMNTLGSLICETEDGTRFKVGTGFDDETRKEIWEHRPQYLGQLAKVKYTDIGKKDLPRFPVWLGFRPAADLDASSEPVNENGI